MSFDIYGNNLRGGHCEVHPHVHEEYPCSVCLAESASRHQSQPEPDYAAMQMESDLAQQGAYIKELTARIRVLETALVQAVDCVRVWHNMGVPVLQCSELWDLYWRNAPEMKPIREALLTQQPPNGGGK